MRNEKVIVSTTISMNIIPNTVSPVSVLRSQLSMQHLYLSIALSLSNLMCLKQNLSTLPFPNNKKDNSFSLKLFFKDFVYLFQTEGKGGRAGKKHQCVVASCTPPPGDLAHNLVMCPRLGIKPATLWFAGRHSIHSATQARGTVPFLTSIFLSLKASFHPKSSEL